MGFSTAPARGRSASSATQPRSVQPRQVKDASAFESLTSHIKTWSPFDQTTQHSPTMNNSPRLNQNASLSEGANGVGVTALGAVAVSETNVRPTSATAQQQTDSTTFDAPNAQSVVWSAWDFLEPESNSSEPRRVLLQAYNSTGFSIWDCFTLDQWHELLNVPTLDDCFRSPAEHSDHSTQHQRASSSASLRDRFPLGLGSITSAKLLPSPAVAADDIWAESRPLLAIVTQRTEVDELGLAGDVDTSQVLLYSLKSHAVIHTIELAGKASKLLANKRFVVVGTQSPLAVHVLSSATLHPTPFSPLTELAANPFTGAPVFDLGNGGRLLAFATDRVVSVGRMAAEARQGAGIVAHRGMFDSDHLSLNGGHQREPSDELENGSSAGGHFAVDARTAGQVGGEVARRVGEAALSGVKAIGDMGMSYWASRNAPTSPPTESTSPGAARHFSKSAPAGNGFGGRRASLSPIVSPRMSFAPLREEEGTTSKAAGTVMVVDLLSYVQPDALKSSTRGRKPSSGTAPLKVIAHFRPYSHPLALLSLSPSSAHLLAANSAGHSFDVFELKPATIVGQSATGIVDPSAPGKVWHRYRLNRGFTAAQASTASWAHDSRFVTVATGKGTTHVYAIEPFGGKPELETHFGAKVVNATDLKPLSVTLGTIARLRRARQQLEHHSPTGEKVGSPEVQRAHSRQHSTVGAAVPPVLAFVSIADSIASSFRPSQSKQQSPVTRPLRSPTLRPAPLSGLSSSSAKFQDCIVFHPSTATAVLQRLASRLAPPPAAAASRGDVGRLATHAVSGISQLMGGTATPSSPTRAEWVVACSAKAEWPLVRPEHSSFIAEPVVDQLESHADASVDKKEVVAPATTMRYSAQAEIRTQSNSTRVMPRSVYNTQQFDFFALPENHAALTKVGNFSLPLRRIQVRKEVKVRDGSHSPAGAAIPSSSLGLSSSPGGSETTEVVAGSFDQPIKSAMHSIIDQDALSSPHLNSPRALAPTFPNGVPGKQGTWRDSIPIRHVAPTVQEGLGRVRRELGRVAKNRQRRATYAGGVGAAGGEGPNGEVYSSSVSFDDDEAVFADRGEEEDASTEGTSDGWEEGENAGGAEHHAKQVQSALEEAVQGEGFFEEDGEVDMWELDVQH